MAAGRRIFYWAPDTNQAVGGVRVIYRHVEILCRNGFNAAVLHRQPGFRVTWFDSDVPVTYLPNVLLERGPGGDTVVVPELMAGESLTQFPRVRKVIFNQGFFLTFSEGPFVAGSMETPYRHPDVVGVLVNSQAALDYLSYAFADVPMQRVRIGIDPALFFYQEKKKLQIAFMPRRNAYDLTQILTLLKFRGILGNIPLAPIENIPLAESARILRESLFFLNVGTQEGFAMPAAEAMACGCVTVGYHGFGGREYMTPTCAYPVEPCDVLAAARALEGALVSYQQDRTSLDEKRRAAARTIAETYSPASEEADVVAAWEQIEAKRQ